MKPIAASESGSGRDESSPTSPLSPNGGPSACTTVPMGGSVEIWVPWEVPWTGKWVRWVKFIAPVISDKYNGIGIVASLAVDS